MRPRLHRHQLERTAERALQSEAARAWYRQQRTEGDVRRRLDAIKAHRQERAPQRVRRPPLIPLLAVATALAAATLAAVLWLAQGSSRTAPRADLAGTSVPAAGLASGAPTICASISVLVHNSSGRPTLAMALVGTRRASWPLLGTEVLLRTSPVLGVPLALPAAGASVLAAIPCDGTLPGMIGYLQTVEIDPGAASGLVFAAGLNLFIADC